MLYRPIPGRARQAIQVAAEEFEVTAQQVMGDSHEKRIVLGRRRAIRYLLRLQFSRAQIGRFLGLNHASVIYHERIDKGLPGKGKVMPEVIEKLAAIPCPDLSGEWAI